MIKIEPLFATDYPQVCALLAYQPDFEDTDNFVPARAFFFRGLTFWQHWLPLNLHFASSVYVARENGVILGLVAVRTLGKSKSCWKFEQLIVHPHHRGRGIAQELLRYVFALFGSQGVNHFIAEVSDQNSAALSLSASFGFCRCAKLTHYQIELEPQFETVTSPSPFRLATSSDKQKLFQLFQEVLPPDIRAIFSLTQDDFSITKPMTEKIDKLKAQVARRQSWYWVCEDKDRKVLSSAVKVTAHEDNNYYLEFAISPGWTDQAQELLAFCLKNLRSANSNSIIATKVYDFETYLIQAMEELKMERTGGFCLLSREHWQRAKKPRKLRNRSVVLPPIINPA